MPQIERVRDLAEEKPDAATGQRDRPLTLAIERDHEQRRTEAGYQRMQAREAGLGRECDARYQHQQAAGASAGATCSEANRRPAMRKQRQAPDKELPGAQGRQIERSSG